MDNIVKQLGILITTESILYKGTILLGMSIDFRKGLGGSKP